MQHSVVYIAKMGVRNNIVLPRESRRLSARKMLQARDTARLVGAQLSWLDAEARNSQLRRSNAVLIEMLDVCRDQKQTVSDQLKLEMQDLLQKKIREVEVIYERFYKERIGELEYELQKQREDTENAKNA